VTAQYLRVFLCAGMPNSGKTTWTHYYKEHNPNVQRYCLDTFFRDPQYEKVVGFVRNIQLHCSSLRWNKTRYLHVTKKILQKGIEKAEGIVDVLIEGYVISSIEKELIEILKELGCNEICRLQFQKQHTLVYKRNLINFHTDDEKTIPEACIKSHDDLKRIDFSKLKKGINYQSFTDFNHRGDSMSPTKLQLAEIEITDGQSFLDVGCNNGFFCFEIAKQTSGSIVGIDVNPDVLCIANRLNNRVFRKQNVKFICCNALNFDSSENFDVVFCASTFHYFGDSQEKFFTLVSNLVKIDGIVIIEIETYNNNDHPQKGSGNRKLAYPNKRWIEEKTAGKLEIIKIKKSLQQPGSDFPRFFYYFKKVLC